MSPPKCSGRVCGCDVVGLVEAGKARFEADQERVSLRPYSRTEPVYDLLGISEDVRVAALVARCRATIDELEAAASGDHERGSWDESAGDPDPRDVAR